MDVRTNAGYVITDSVHIGATEFVIGMNEAAPSKFVTWACRNGDDYYWGHYMTSRKDAEQDLLERAGQELKMQMQLSAGRGAKQKDREEER